MCELASLQHPVTAVVEVSEGQPSLEYIGGRDGSRIHWVVQPSSSLPVYCFFGLVRHTNAVNVPTTKRELEGRLRLWQHIYVVAARRGQVCVLQVYVVECFAPSVPGYFLRMFRVTLNIGGFLVPIWLKPLTACLFWARPTSGTRQQSW